MRSCCAVYVDVGYLLAAAATRVTGSSLRRGVQTDYASLIAWLGGHAQEDSGLPLLRINWYDAGGRPGGMPDPSQDEIGQLPGVKLRLGRLSYSGEQKGVDVRIGLDLAIQAQHRVADVVYLVSGDDDLTEAVEEAQSQGVQVVLLAVPRHDENPLAVSKHLLRAVDRTLVIDQDAVDAAFKPTAIPEALIPSDETADDVAEDDVAEDDVAIETSDADTATDTGEESGARRRVVRVGGKPVGVPTPGPKPGPPPSEQPIGAADTDDTADTADETPPVPAAPSPAMFARRKAGGLSLPGAAAAVQASEGLTLGLIDAVARQVVVAWCSSADPEALARLRAAAPTIPSELDRALLVDLASRSDHADLDDETRHTVRARFWQHIGNVRPV